MARPGAVIEEARILAELRSRLPSYMVPALIEPISGLPTLPSGKVDRKRLPEPRPREAMTRTDLIEPRNAKEEKIAAVWRRLFAPVAVSVEDDFFLAAMADALSDIRLDDG